MRERKLCSCCCCGCCFPPSSSHVRVQLQLSQRPIPIPLHTSSLPQSRSSHIDHFHLLFLHFNILPKVHVKQQSKAMSNSKPYVSLSGTVGAQPLTHKISIKLSDFATLAYLFFETLVSVSQDKWQIHIFYLSCVHIMIGRKRIKR